VTAGSDCFTVTITAGGVDVGLLDAVPGVRRVDVVGDRVSVHGGRLVPPYVGRALVDRGITPDDMDVVRPSLEDVYLRLVDGEGAS
jgi:hypothetical protein